MLTITRKAPRIKSRGPTSKYRFIFGRFLWLDINYIVAQNQLNSLPMLNSKIPTRRLANRDFRPLPGRRVGAGEPPLVIVHLLAAPVKKMVHTDFDVSVLGPACGGIRHRVGQCHSTTAVVDEDNILLDVSTEPAAAEDRRVFDPGFRPDLARRRVDEPNLAEGFDRPAGPAGH